MMVQMNTMSSSGPRELKLVDRMKAAGDEMHTKVEQRQFIQDLINGKASPQAYLQYLVDLECIYSSLEIELDFYKSDKRIAPIIIPELYRATKLDKDIDFFSNMIGSRTSRSEAAIEFKSAMLESARTGIHRLPAYAYIRMLGDLFGGRMIGEAVEKVWEKGSTNFYDYSELMENRNVESLPRFAHGVYRPAFNQLNLTIQEEDELLAEVIKAYELTDVLLASYEGK